MVWNIGFNDGMGVTYSLVEMDGDIRKIEYLDRTYSRGTVAGGFDAGDLNLGRLIKSENVPTKFLWGGPKNRKLPDALLGPMHILLVSDRIKNIIERFEPGLHQFFPADVFYKSNNELAQKMYYLNICTLLESVDKELTSSPFSGIMWRPDKGGELVFNLDQIGQHHLWHDKHIMHGWMMSNALHDALVEKGITGLVFHKDRDNQEWQ
jgi:hypothetical protein